MDAIKTALTAEQTQAIADMGTLTIDDLVMGGRGGGPATANGTPDPGMMQGTPGAGNPGGPGNGQGGRTPPAADGTGPQNPGSLQTTIESIKASTTLPGLNPDLIGLVITTLQMVK